MDQKLSTPKTLAWVYSVVAAFTIAYIVGGLILDRQAKKRAG